MADKINIGKGTIDSGKIYETHRKIKSIVDTYNSAKTEVNKITRTVQDNWVGKGRDEFESQFDILVNKIDDFGDLLKEIYEALVESEAKYEAVDDSARQDFEKYNSEMKKG